MKKKLYKKIMEGSMKKVKVLLLVSLIFGFSQVILFSAISSRVEGVVIDELGQAIKGADVALFEVENETPLIKKQVIIRNYAKTGDNGFFRIDDLKSGNYFISIMKVGYAVFGPIHAFELDLLGNFDQDKLDLNKINSFYLKEGQIKYFKIQMEKEAILKIIILRKTPIGIEPVSKFISLYPIKIKHPSYANDINDSIRNELTVPFLKEGLISVEISYQGEMLKKYNITLEKGKSVILNHVFDFTIGQVVSGIVKDKTNGEPILGVDISLAKEDDPKDNYYYFSTTTEDKGDFWIGELKPGLYKLCAHYLFSPNESNERIGDFSTTFTIGNNEKKIINIEL